MRAATHFKTVFLFLSCFFIVSCASFDFRARQGDPRPSGALSLETEKLVQSAKSLLGQKPDAYVQVRGKTFMLDCIGTLSAAFWGVGVDIQKNFRSYSGNGVNRLFLSLKDSQNLHWKKTPVPGDIVLWDNTWDANNDGVFGNDGHTHAGIVVQVDPDNTVHYLHASVTRGVVISYLNLNWPKQVRDASGKTLNSPLYLGASERNKNNPPRWLSGDLWEAFGDSSGILRNFAL